MLAFGNGINFALIYLLNRGLKSDSVDCSALVVLQQTLHIWTLAKQTLNVHFIDSKTVYRHSALYFFKNRLSSFILIKHQVGKCVNVQNCLGSTVQNYKTEFTTVYAFPFLSARAPVCLHEHLFVVTLIIGVNTLCYIQGQA